MEAIIFYNKTEGVVGAPWVFLTLVGILGLAALGFLLNPKLAQWAELNATMEKDGSVVTSRPRPFPLAFTEWVLVLINVLATILGLVGFALISLLSL